MQVKQVKKSRGERLLEELKSTESAAKKRPLPDNQKSSSFTIPKKKKTDSGPADKRPNTVLTSPPHAAPSSFAAALNRSSAPPAKRLVTGNGLRKPPAPKDRTDSPINGVNNANDEATVAAQPMEDAGPSGLPDNGEPPKRPRKGGVSFSDTTQVRYIEPRQPPPPQADLSVVPYNAAQHPSSRQMESNQVHHRQPHNGDNSHGGYPERSRDPRHQAHSTSSNGIMVPVSNLRPPSSGSSSRNPRAPHRSTSLLEAELCSLEVTSETTQTQLNDRFRYQMLMRILRWNPKWIVVRCIFCRKKMNGYRFRL